MWSGTLSIRGCHKRSVPTLRHLPTLITNAYIIGASGAGATRTWHPWRSKSSLADASRTLFWHSGFALGVTGALAIFLQQTDAYLGFSHDLWARILRNVAGFEQARLRHASTISPQAQERDPSIKIHKPENCKARYIYSARIKTTGIADSAIKFFKAKRRDATRPTFSRVSVSAKASKNFSVYKRRDAKCQDL